VDAGLSRGILRRLKPEACHVKPHYSELAYSSPNPIVRSSCWSRLRSMARMAQRTSATVILDIGCGKGQLLKLIADEQTGSSCIGIDINRDIYLAKEEAKLERYQNVQFLRADCTYLPLRPECSQLAFCASVLEHLHNVQGALHEVSGVLAPGGKLVAGIPTENWAYRLGRKVARLRKPVDHYYRAEYLEGMLEREFTQHRVLKLPFRLIPRGLSLYLITVCVKNSRLQKPGGHDV
jgi:SAM-dependent methyltransferase